MDFTYLHQQPARWTFEQAKLRQWVESYCCGRVLNLFAGKTRLSIEEVRVDISDEFKPDYCIDAYKFITETSENFDAVILDPPYNLRKSREKYGEGRYIGSLQKIKNQLARLLPIGGLIVHLGYDSVGLGNRRGFEKIAICLVCHGGDHNDTICLVERKTRNDLFPAVADSPPKEIDNVPETEK